MRWTVDRLRLAIIILAAVLLSAIVGSIFYGRWRLRQIAQDLPTRLGIQIQQTTQGFVLSKTEQGRTVFTLHAARAIAFKTGGRVLLHDVKIDMYNPQDNQPDTVAGKVFEYDRESQIVRAQGQAHIVLQVPGHDSDQGTTTDGDAQVVNVTTHGLTFDQKTGVATCSGEVEFQFSKSSGTALGAEYDSKRGRLLLQSQVVLTTDMHGQPAVVHASQATYDRGASRIHLIEPRYSAHTPHGNDRASAGMATVFLGPGGSVERLDAENAVELVAADGTSVRSSKMHVQLNESNQPQSAHFLGGVQFNQDQPLQQTTGDGREATVGFDSDGHPNRIHLDGDVKFQQQMTVGKGHLHRVLTADQLVLHLRQGKSGQAQLKTADATGSPNLTSQTTTPGRPPQKTSLGAQTLQAKFLAGNEIQHLDGAGETRISMVAANGDIDTSAGDTLSIDFVTGTPKGAEKTSMQHPGNGSDRGIGERLTPQSIQSAVQTGHVVLQQTSANRKSSADATTGPQVSTATASSAYYNGTSDTLTLTGKPKFRDASLEMTADRFQVQRAAGKVLASGAVETTLLPSSRAETLPGGLLSGSEPTHIIARNAVLVHDPQKAVFSGKARLWQGDNTVEAPVIELSQKMQTLSAYGNGACTECVRSTLLQQSAEPASHGNRKASHSGPQEAVGPSMLRVLSRRLLYSDAERKASFFQDVEAVSSNGDLFAGQIVAFLTPAVAHFPANSIATRTENGGKVSFQRSDISPSSIEKIVATGNVLLKQLGRRGTGTRLVYTASDGHFVLTGTPGSPPRVVDAQQGTITGQVLTFASQTQAIIVSGTANESAMTKMRVEKK